MIAAIREPLRQKKRASAKPYPMHLIAEPAEVCSHPHGLPLQLLEMQPPGLYCRLSPERRRTLAFAKPRSTEPTRDPDRMWAAASLLSCQFPFRSNLSDRLFPQQARRTFHRISRLP